VSLVPIRVEPATLTPLLNWLDQRLGALPGAQFHG
jgi:hypothetical protein